MAPAVKTTLTLLPQHILSQIVTCTIVDSAPSEALKLRLVNKKFNHEVLHVVFEKGFNFESRDLPNEVTVFRYFRGFLLRRECEEKLLALRQNLLEAAVLLTDLAKSLDSTDQFSGDFIGLYESKPEQTPSEDAIAAIATSAIQYVGGPLNVCRIWAGARKRKSIDIQSEDDASSHRSVTSDVSDADSIEPDEDPAVDQNGDDNEDDANDDEEEEESRETRGPWTPLAAKDINFWVLLTASHFGKLDLVQKSLALLRESCGPDFSLTHDLQSVFQLPVQQGHQSIIKFLLEQPELAPASLPQSFVLNNKNALETAIKAEQVSVVKILLASGWDLAQIATDYTSALMHSIRYTTVAAIREELVQIFLQITQEWRSSSMTRGIFREICSKGDTKLAGVVLQKIKDNTMDLAQFTWEWTLPERYEDWSFDDQTALTSACSSGDTELVKFLFENRTHFPRSMNDCFRTSTIRRCLENAISSNNREILTELLQHKKKISAAKLLAYATIQGDIDTIKMLAKEVDLHAKVKRDRYFQSYDSGSNLSYELSDLDLRKTPFLYDKGCVTIGGFCLAIAIKTLKTEVAEFFISQNIRIGTRLTFLSRNFVCNKAAIIAPDTSSLGSRAFLLTYKQIYLPDCKNMLGRGAKLFNKALVLTKKEKGWGWKLSTSKIMRDADARVISCIQVPGMSFDQEKWDQMWELLSKHKLPLLYMDDDD